MKNSISKVISIILIVVTVLSLSSCAFWNDTPSSGGEPQVLDLFCYSLTTDKETYNYGDEIEITAAIRFTESKPYVGTFTVYLEESPSFEIIGDAKYVFEDVKVEDYCCHKKTDKIIVSFKVKITEVDEARYSSNLFNIVGEYKYYYASREYTRAHYFWLFYIVDSQGIIVNQLPYSYEHNENGGGHGTDHTKGRISGLEKQELLISSYNREYLSGVSVEELIDRYVRDDFDMKNRIFYYGSSTEPEDYSSEYFYLSYVSSGVRFKIYLPKDNECVKLYKDRPVFYASDDEAVKEYLEKLLSFALENGAITEEEYNAEISSILDGEENVVVQGHAYPRIISSNGEPTKLWKMQDELVFTVPTGDDFYNRVITVGK